MVAALLQLVILGSTATSIRSLCPASSLPVGDGACVAAATGRITLTDGVTVGTQSFAGCVAGRAAKVLHSTATLVQLERNLVCAPSKYHTEALAATVTDTFSVVTAPSRAIEWNTSVTSATGRFWTTELNDAISVTTAVNASIWAAATTGSRLEAGSSSLDATPLAEFKGRTYYGRDQWSSNGKGTVMLCSGYGGASCPTRSGDELASRPSLAAAATDKWFTTHGAIPCPYPKCCTVSGPCEPGPPGHLLVVLGNASSHPPVRTGADCQKLCAAHADCDVWQLGSARHGRNCEWAKGLTYWKPMMQAGSEKVAGCKLGVGIAGCGHNPPIPPSPPRPPSPSRGVTRTTALPIISLLFPDSGRGISLVQDLLNLPNNAYIDATGNGSVVWTRQWYRLGNATEPVQLRRFLVPHADDWREGVGFLVKSQRSAFEVHPSVNRSAIDGGGSFADYRGEGDQRPFSAAIGDGWSSKLQQMNYQVNWATTANEGESHGTWMPFNLSTGKPFKDGWTTCMGIPNFTAYFTEANRVGGQWHNKSSYQYPTPCSHKTYRQLEGWYKDLAAFGFTTMLYGNYWEYGWSCDGGRGDRANPKDNDCLIDPHGIPTDRPLPQCEPPPHCDPREAGFPTHDPEAPAQRACKLRLLCDTQLFMRRSLMPSILRPWSDAAGRLVTNGSMSSGVIKTGMEGAFLLDAGMPEYAAHLEKMATLSTQLLPTAAGIAFDGTGWQGRINLDADDERSYVELHEVGETGGPFVRLGAPIHTQVSSKFSIQQAIGELLHSAGKAHFWNPYAPRADFMLHTDGVFSEDSYEDERMHLHSTLGIGGKPIITWNPGCEAWPSSQCGRYRNSNDNAQLLQRLLYWGVQPMLPFNRNDHAITRYVAEQGNDTDIFLAYGPLFRALRGRRWSFTPHVVKVTSGAAAANVYELPDQAEVVLCVSLATPGSDVRIAVRGVKATGFELVSPAGGDGTTVHVAPSHDQVRAAVSGVDVHLKMGTHGAAVVRLVASASASHR